MPLDRRGRDESRFVQTVWPALQDRRLDGSPHQEEAYRGLAALLPEQSNGMSLRRSE